MRAWIGAALVVAAAAASVSLSDEFSTWAATHGRSYSTVEERAERFKLWAAALDGARHGVHGLTPYSDRTPDELALIFPAGGETARAIGGVPPPPVYPFTPFSADYVAMALQKGIDWRAAGVVTPVRLPPAYPHSQRRPCGAPPWSLLPLSLFWANSFCFQGALSLYSGRQAALSPLCTSHWTSKKATRASCSRWSLVCTGTSTPS